MSVKFRLTVMSFLQFFVWGAWLITVGNYWFGTNGAGVYRYDEKTLKQYTVSDGLADNQVINIQEDEFGTLGVQYTEVIPLLVAAIKEQNTMIESLRQRLSAANL